MSSKQSNKPALLCLEDHADVPAGQSTSSTNDSTPYSGATPSLAPIPPYRPEMYEAGPSTQSQDTGTLAEAQQPSSSEQDHDATPPAPRLPNLETPQLSPFSDPITPERRSPPSTDEQRAESRVTINSIDNVYNEGYSYGVYLRGIKAEMAQSSSRSNNQHAPTRDLNAITATPTRTVIRRHASVPSLRSSSSNDTQYLPSSSGLHTGGQRELVQYQYSHPSFQSLTPCPSGTMEPVPVPNNGLVDESIDREDELPERTRPLVHDTIDRYGRNVRNVFRQGGQTADQGTELADLSHSRMQARPDSPHLRGGAEASQAQQQQQQQQGAEAGSQGAAASAVYICKWAFSAAASDDLVLRWCWRFGDSRGLRVRVHAWNRASILGSRQLRLYCMNGLIN